MTCGACCAAYRVSFYWGEAAARNLPEALAEKLNAWLLCMKGTSQAQPHCAALTGTIGGRVQCSCYDARPTPCREVQEGDDQCRRARARYGLPPLADAGAPAEEAERKEEK